jgi:diguanylate cyclase (GGDEF)-like protein
MRVRCGRQARLDRQNGGWSTIATIVHVVAVVSALVWAFGTRQPGLSDSIFLILLAVLALALPLERHASKLRLLAVAWEANHDPLTGLHNRRYFMGQLAKRLSRHLRRRRLLSVLLLDLDHFKNINDTLGHASGDQLLKGVAERLRSSLGSQPIIARLGGDEFGILTDVTSKDELERFAQQTVDALSFRTTLLSQPVWVNGSVGAAAAEAPKPTLEELLSRADIALYQAKNSGRNQAMVFEPHRPMPTIGQLSRDYELRLAVDREQLLLYYQPIIDLHTGKVSGFEALARWKHPTLGFLDASDFIPIAEENGWIHEIGAWITMEACRQASEWQQLYGEGISISINLSALQFARPDIVRELAAAVSMTGVKPESVDFEITETAFSEDESLTLQNILDLKEIGANLSIDDFGIGYSSLNYLRRFPADYLKIDRSFVAEIEDERSFGVIKAAIAVGHALGMEIIAEGVETSSQLKLLMEAGADFAQGFLFYKPLTVAAAASLLVERFAMDDGAGTMGLTEELSKAS